VDSGRPRVVGPASNPRFTHVGAQRGPCESRGAAQSPEVQGGEPHPQDRMATSLLGSPEWTLQRGLASEDSAYGFLAVASYALEAGQTQEARASLDPRHLWISARASLLVRRLAFSSSAIARSDLNSAPSAEFGV
jgi:hypothetical protein